MGEHDPLLLTLNILALFALFATVAFNVLTVFPTTGIFFSTPGEISTSLAIEITPATFVFNIWNVIYIWQFIWIVYSLTLLCRRGPDGPLYLNPVLLSSAFFGVFILNLFLNVSWLFLFDRQTYELSFVFLAAIALTLYITLGLSYLAVFKNRFLLAKQNRRIDVFLVFFLVQNGLGVYAAWATLATILNMTIVIAFRSNPPIDTTTASTISLAILAAILIIYVSTDLTVFDKYARYTFSPYFVVIWALVGILIVNGVINNTNVNFIIVAVLVGITVVALILKITLAVLRARRNPLIPKDAKEEGE